jgi:hypothetical protein
MVKDKNIEFYAQPPVIVLTAAHCLKKRTRVLFGNGMEAA